MARPCGRKGTSAPALLSVGSRGQSFSFSFSRCGLGFRSPSSLGWGLTSVGCTACLAGPVAGAVVPHPYLKAKEVARRGQG